MLIVSRIFYLHINSATPNISQKILSAVRKSGKKIPARRVGIPCRSLNRVADWRNLTALWRWWPTDVSRNCGRDWWSQSRSSSRTLSVCWWTTARRCVPTTPSWCWPSRVRCLSTRFRRPRHECWWTCETACRVTFDHISSNTSLHRCPVRLQFTYTLVSKQVSKRMIIVSTVTRVTSQALNNS